MSVNRSEGRRKRKTDRAFRPTLDGSLEPKLLLSNASQTFLLNHPKIGFAYKLNSPPFRHGTHARPFPKAPVPRGPESVAEVGHGGQTLIVATPNGSRFQISLTYYFQPSPTGTTTTATTQSPIQGQTPGGSGIQPQGTVRAYAMSGGRIGLILDGTTNQTELTISPEAKFQRKGYAHSFSYGMAAQSDVLNIGQITVNSGQLAAVEGFHTADLSGPLVISGNQPVDRIAFDALLPGASIQIGTDLNTLDILKGVNLNSGPGIVIGRDLNLLNVGQDLDLSNGASIKVGRYLGLVPQPPKGTATGSNFLSLNQSLVGTGTSTIVPSLSAYIQGNLNIGPGSVLALGAFVNPEDTIFGGIANSSLTASGTSTSPAVLLVSGKVIAPLASNIAIPNILMSNSISSTVGTPPNQQTIFFNFVVRNGSNSPFFVNTASFPTT
jgi:hypothetical protein